MLKRLYLVLAFVFAAFPAFAQVDFPTSQTNINARGVQVMCLLAGVSFPCDAGHPLQVAGSLSLAGSTSNAGSGVATTSLNLPTVSYNYGFNGATWDQLQVDGSKNLKVLESNSAAILAGVTAAIPPCSTSPCTTVIGAVVPFQGTTALSATNGGYYNILQGNVVLSATNGIYTNLLQGNAVLSATNPIFQIPTSQYPSGAVPITISATGTTGATTATLAASASIKTYICGFSIRANATAAATANSTVTGTVTGTLNFTQWTAPLASGIGLTEQVFMPCIPSSAINTGIAVISAAPGTGGVVSVTAWGYQL